MKSRIIKKITSPPRIIMTDLQRVCVQKKTYGLLLFKFVIYMHTVHLFIRPIPESNAVYFSIFRHLYLNIERNV